ncbi:MAG TPA: cyclic nucleotide-binding domain-containing protein [Euzebyales bacterium]|nr:cyclic nucleotide-binding domain-containing protein [Euzebyales bacterium]
MSDLTESDRIEHLRSVPLFAGVSNEGLDRVLAAASEHEVPAGHVLIQPDQAGSGLFIIEDGTVVVERPNGIVELGAGEFIGELALLFDGAVHSVRVRAATPVRVLALARDDFTALIESEPQVALAMLRVLARRLWNASR